MTLGKLQVEERDMEVMVKKVVLEIMREMEFDIESLLESEPEAIEGLIFEKVFAVLQKDPRHIEAVTTFGNEELEKLELN
ncbi:MAG: hypothetical protein V1648_05110 [Candidatus Aenigmatarchaeota archaeon]